jgi:hypothetical protein
MPCCRQGHALSHRAKRSSVDGRPGDTVPSTMATNPDSTAVCAFCGRSTDISPSGDGVEILISRRGDEGTQEMFAHMSCLGARLYPGTPYLFETVEDGP